MSEQEEEVCPAWFFDEHGNRLGINRNEAARCRWFAERGLPDPAKVSAAQVAQQRFTNDFWRP